MIGLDPEDEIIAQYCKLSNAVQAAMDTAPDYEMLSNVMAAHVQRMICDKARNRPDEALRLAAKFHEHCLTKIKFITGLAYPG